jgi:hypothetical protein
MSDDLNLLDGVDEDVSDADLALLDKTLDEIEDLPGFEVPYNGRYLLKLNRKIKKIKDKACVEAEFEVMECLKKDNDADPDTVPGSKFGTLFFLQGTEDAVRISMGMLKKLAAPIAESVGEGNLKVIVKDHMTDVLMMANVARRQDKENPEVFRARMSNYELA